MGDDFGDEDAWREPGVNGMGIASLICGILSLFSLGCCCIPIISYLAMVVNPMLAVLAMVFGGLGVATASNDGSSPVPSYIGIGLGVLNFILMGVMVVMMFVGVGGIVLLDSM